MKVADESAVSDPLVNISTKRKPQLTQPKVNAECKDEDKAARENGVAIRNPQQEANSKDKVEDDHKVVVPVALVIGESMSILTPEMSVAKGTAPHRRFS